TAIFVEPKNTEFGYDYKDLPKEVGEWMASLPWGEMYQLVYEIKSYKSPIVSELKENNELRMDKYVQLFIENRGGYSEENSIKIEVNKNNSVQKFEFFLGANNDGGIKRLRIDPLNDYAVLKINSIQINEHIYEAPLNTNAFFVEDKIHYFFTADSQIYLDVSQYTSIDKVRCDFEYLCRGKDALDRFLSVFVDMDKKHNEVIIDLKEKLKLETKSKLFETETRDREIEKLSHKIDEIYVSMSWKITKPLRKTFELIRNATR
ncbi:MAG: hypothetical protein QG558_901, partial [Campylobacterota bacterium]|nr:hypothetical protein [Campylobacterota bacterium]